MGNQPQSSNQSQDKNRKFNEKIVEETVIISKQLDESPTKNQNQQIQNQGNQGQKILNQTFPIPQKNYVGVITMKTLTDTFNSNCIDNLYLNKVRFNEAIKRLLYNMNLPTIAFTYLTDRLYDIVDESGDGRISLNEFTDGMGRVLSDSELRKRMSFLCIMKAKENRGFVTFAELLYFFYSSWVSGFTILGKNLLKEKEDLHKQGIQIPSVNQIVTWAKNYQDHIKIYLENSLKECGIDPSRDIYYEQYKFWISRNPQNIQLVYGNKYLTIATNLTSLDDVDYRSQ